MSNESITDGTDTRHKNRTDGATEAFHDTGVAVRAAAKDLGALASAVQAEAKHGYQQLTDIAEVGSSKAVKFVRKSFKKRPMLSVGIVAGVAVLLGLAVSRRD